MDIVIFLRKMHMESFFLSMCRITEYNEVHSNENPELILENASHVVIKMIPYYLLSGMHCLLCLNQVNHLYTAP